MAGGVMAKMVIEVPEEFTEVGRAIAEHLAALQRTVLRLGGGKAVDYAEIEQAMAESTGRMELAGHRAILQSLDIDVPAVIIGGVRYTRVGRCEAPYHTMVGSVSVERSLYRQSGERGGQPGGRVVDAVSLRAGVVGDGWLPRAARAMAHAVQQGPSREAEASAREFGRLPYSRASFERVAHLVGALAVADHQDIEDALIDAVEVPEEARSISVSLDRVSVPMEEPRPRPRFLHRDTDPVQRHTNRAGFFRHLDGIDQGVLNVLMIRNGQGTDQVRHTFETGARIRQAAKLSRAGFRFPRRALLHRMSHRPRRARQPAVLHHACPQAHRIHYPAARLPPTLARLTI